MVLISRRSSLNLVVVVAVLCLQPCQAWVTRSLPLQSARGSQQQCPHYDSAGENRRAFLSIIGTWSAIATAAGAAAPLASVAAVGGTLGSAVRVLGDVEKSPNDPRAYRALQLGNGLRVLLVSDADAKSGAAAMDVHVGHFSDPEDLPGLAHAAEHMLFLGTDKFPDEAEYSSYLSAHGGTSNAYTATEDTCYYFDVGADYLRGALDRFSEFFKSPQFTPSATERELSAVDSEDAKNKQSDGFRAYQLEKGRANSAHPYSKFGTGNKLTLAATGREGGIRGALLEFFDRYYSANQMTLAILGKQPLDELQRWTTELFSPIPDKGVPPPAAEWAGKVAPFAAGKPTEFDVVPVQEIRKLSIVWPHPFAGPAEKLSFLLAKPDVYIGTLLGHEGQGSLLSYLKKRGWANGLACQLGTVTDDFCTFVLEADLTAEGLAHRRDVVSAVYSFLGLVAASGMPQYVVRELKVMSDVAWRFQEKASAEGLVEALAGSMQAFPLTQAISGPRRLRVYDESQVQSLLAALNPSNGLVTAFAKDFAGAAKEREKWYGTPYAAVPLNGEVKGWQAAAATPLPGVTLPRPNPFVPEGEADLRIKATRRRKPSPGDPAVPPELLRSDDQWFVNYKQDDVFAQPKSYAYFELLTPEVYATPRAVALLKLFQLSLDDKLNEYAYEAQVAGLSYSLDFTARGARLVFGGLNAKMPRFIGVVVAAVASHVPSDAAEFARHKDTVLRELASYDRQQPYYHASFNAAVATEEPRFTVPQVKAAVEAAKLSDFAEFLPKCFSRGFGLALLQGNLDASEVADYLGPVERAFKFAALPPEERPARRVVVLPPTPAAGAGTVLQKATLNADDDNSATQLVYQIGDRGTESRVLCELLASMMQEPFYDSLRTKQELGYLVFSGLKRVEGIHFLYFMVQSGVKDPNYCADRVAEFVEGFRGTLAAMGTTALAAFVEGLVDSKIEVDQRLAQEATRNWDEIAGGELKFNRRIEEAKALKGVTPAKLLEFWDQHLAVGATNRRVLTSQVFARQHSSALGRAPAGGELAGEDAQAFRQGKELFPPQQARWAESLPVV